MITSFSQLPDRAVAEFAAARQDVVVWVRRLYPNPSDKELRAGFDQWWNVTSERNGYLLEGFLANMGISTAAPVVLAPAPTATATAQFSLGGLLQNKLLVYGVGGYLVLKMLRVVR